MGMTHERRKQTGRGDGDNIQVRSGVGALDGFNRFVMCGELALGSFAVVCLE